jgi:mRNA interferase MazF
MVSRGDIVRVSAPGDYGKPRPALIIQSDFFNPTHASIIVCLISSDLQDAPLFRVDIAPTPENGLQRRSQIMVDKIVTLRRERTGEAIGRANDQTLRQVERLLMVFLGLSE